MEGFLPDCRGRGAGGEGRGRLGGRGAEHSDHPHPRRPQALAYAATETVMEVYEYKWIDDEVRGEEDMEDDVEGLGWTRQHVVDGMRKTEEKVGHEHSEHSSGGVVDDSGVAGLHLGHPPPVAPHLGREGRKCRRCE